MKVGVQIIKENWMESMVRRAEESLTTLTIRKPVVKHIPIQCWSEINKRDAIQDVIAHDKTPCSRIYSKLPDWVYQTRAGEIRNSGGKTYIVTQTNYTEKQDSSKGGL